MQSITNPEASVLGASLHSREACSKALHRLTADAFTEGAHRILFKALKKLQTKNTPVDLTTVSAELQSNGELDAVGGVSYLCEIMNETPSAANVDYYINAVLNEQKRRTWMALNTEALNAAANGGDYLAAAQKAIKAAEAFKCSEVRPAGDDFIRAFMEIGKNPRGIKTGFAQFDTGSGGLKPGHVAVVGARPSVGKTSFALCVAINAALAGKVVAFFSLEMTKTDILQRACLIHGRTSYGDIVNGNAQKTVDASEAAERLRSTKLFVFDDARSVDEIRGRCWDIKQREKCLDLVVIDYLGLLRSVNTRRGGTREQEVPRIPAA